MSVTITVPPGELVDKITILEIKFRKIKNKEKLSLVKKELKLLSVTLAILLKEHKSKSTSFKKLKTKLYKINQQLWNIEDSIRRLEAKKDFGKRFIHYARSVYITNDERSQVKNEINGLFGSELKEVKQYIKYK
jgi:septal ring factor EnvC (AmiA/AmiB activator)